MVNFLQQEWSKHTNAAQFAKAEKIDVKKSLYGTSIMGVFRAGVTAAFFFFYLKHLKEINASLIV